MVRSVKSALRFDVETADFGDATMAVRRILDDAARTDWFTPPIGDARTAIDRFATYQRLAREWLPDEFSADLRVAVHRGSVESFVTLVERARAPDWGWDWKFDGMKALARTYAERHDFDRKRFRGSEPDGSGMCGPGNLYMRIGESLIFNPITRLDIAASIAPAVRDPLGWYVSWTHIEVFDAIEWQLAAPSEPLDRSPFAELLGVYAEGYLPFHFGRDTALLFAFERSIDTESGAPR